MFSGQILQNWNCLSIPTPIFRDSKLVIPTLYIITVSFPLDLCFSHSVSQFLFFCHTHTHRGIQFYGQLFWSKCSLVSINVKTKILLKSTRSVLDISACSNYSSDKLGSWGIYHIYDAKWHVLFHLLTHNTWLFLKQKFQVSFYQ